MALLRSAAKAPASSSAYVWRRDFERIYRRLADGAKHPIQIALEGTSPKLWGAKLIRFDTGPASRPPGLTH
jgi:hypothetical protein